MLCKCCANSRYKKTIVLKFNTIVSTLVGATGLEPATSWSQTRCATNCATPRTYLLILNYLMMPCSTKIFFRATTERSTCSCVCVAIKA